jgi:DNA-binding transcriptional MerR regulator
VKPPTGMKPIDLAREHGLAPQTVRNHERDGILPPADRTAGGHRVYTPLHAAALRAFRSLAAAHGHATAREVLHAANRGDVDAALRAVEAAQARLARDRATLDAVAAAAGTLTGTVVRDEAGRGGPAMAARSPGTRPPAAGSPRSRPAAPGSPGRDPTHPPEALPVGALAHRLGIVPATLRAWERAGILAPARDPRTRQRRFGPDDVRDAELAHLLRRGGYPLAHIAVVVEQVRTAGGTDALLDSLEAWRARLVTRGLAALTAGGHLVAYLEARRASGKPPSGRLRS